VKRGGEERERKEDMKEKEEETEVVGEDASAAEVATSSVGVGKKSNKLKPQESVGVAVTGWEVLEKTREPLSAQEWVYNAKAEPKVRKGYASLLKLGKSEFPHILNFLELGLYSFWPPTIDNRVCLGEEIPTIWALHAGGEPHLKI
jgi:hypothetical protein